MTIAGLQIVPLKVIPDDRGRVMHMLRSDAPHFSAFGEVYFSTVRRGIVKGWKRHHRMQMNLAVPVGRIRLVACDGRPESPTCGQVEDIFIGQDDYKLAVIAPGIWTAFQGISVEEALVANCASVLHGSEQVDNRSLEDPPCKVDWSIS